MKFVRLALALSGVAASAHHSVESTYDLKHAVEIKGTIRQVLLRNPHCFLQIEAPDEAGTMQIWSLEFPKGANSLREQGIQPGTLKTGDRVTVTLNPAFKLADKRGNLVTLRRESDGFEWTAKAKRRRS